MPKWKSYSIPEELEERIKRIVKARPDRYTSVADFIRDACNERLTSEEKTLKEEREEREQGLLSKKERV